MKRKCGDRIIDIVVWTVLLLFCVICLYPYLNQLAISLNEGMDSARGGVTIFPRKPTLENYEELFANPGYGRAFGITVLRALLNMVIQGLVVFGAAYALTRRNLMGRAFLTKFFALPAYIAPGLIPMYILYRYLGLINNFWVYVLPFSFVFYNMIIVRSFIQEIPEALEESALIDGANEGVILFQIILPLSLPVIATTALWTLVGQWNDWTTTLYYITNEKLYPLQYLMMRVIKQGELLKQQAILDAMGADTSVQTTSESVKAAMIIATSIPIIAIYPFLQKYFVSGMTLGAVKG